MDDPIAGVIDRLQENPTIQHAARYLRANFLNNVAEVFETYGFATTRQFLEDRRERSGLREQASAVLEALDCMEGCQSIHRNRAIGRLLIKTLNQPTRPSRNREGVRDD